MASETLSIVEIGLTRERIDAMLDLLRNFPADGKLTSSTATADCIAFRFVEERQQEGRCQHCGSPRVEYRWHTLTPAGRAILAFADGAA
jgi:hypothetical protein